MMNKKSLLVASGLLLMISEWIFSACGDDHEDSIPQETGKLLASITDQAVGNAIGTVSETGVMRYSDENHQWYIACPIPNTADGIMDYYPLELNDDFKVDGLKVTFSGTVYEFYSDIHDMQCYGNHGIFYIGLSKIEKTQ